MLAREAEKQSYGWYIDEALRESAELLGLSADEVIQGGFEIHTAYDARLQTIADEVYSDQSFFPCRRIRRNADQKRDGCGGYGQRRVLAMVGGRDYTVRRGLNRATQMRRQPGSALKPLAVYGPALELGYTTASVLLDEKRRVLAITRRATRATDITDSSP